MKKRSSEAGARKRCASATSRRIAMPVPRSRTDSAEPVAAARDRDPLERERGQRRLRRQRRGPAALAARLNRGGARRQRPFAAPKKPGAMTESASSITTASQSSSRARSRPAWRAAARPGASLGSRSTTEAPYARAIVAVASLQRSATTSSGRRAADRPPPRPGSCRSRAPRRGRAPGRGSADRRLAGVAARDRRARRGRAARGEPPRRGRGAQRSPPPRSGRRSSEHRPRESRESQTPSLRRQFDPARRGRATRSSAELSRSISPAESPGPTVLRAWIQSSGRAVPAIAGVDASVSGLAQRAQRAAVVRPERARRLRDRLVEDRLEQGLRVERAPREARLRRDRATDDDPSHGSRLSSRRPPALARRRRRGRRARRAAPRR